MSVLFLVATKSRLLKIQPTLISQFQIGEGSVLKLTRVTRSDMGPYLCIASNGVPPAVSKRIVLNVYFQPMIWIENQLVGAYEGQTLVLECHSEAYPTAITYWTRPSNETITNGSFLKPQRTYSEQNVGITIELQGRNDPKGLRDKYEAHYQVRAAAGLRIVQMRGEKFVGGDGWENQTVQKDDG
ncbi:Lachesin [Melipona quadrifasciata]|uniref:Lachesin n=1 Tax=Melipona quadrifasciata TaxID=166423 RepID=A0A0N0U427_9HYME|nr:Lachesin [Melipona quadrifasciata]